MSPEESKHPHPMPDDLSAPFWDSAAEGVLSIQRCADCRRFHFPPVDACFGCASSDLAHEPVSGQAVVHSWTSTEAGARHPYWGSRTPYLVGIVQLVEQADLLLYTNFPGAEPSDLEVGREVKVQFETLPSGHVLPQFAPADEIWSRVAEPNKENAR